jgi:RNA polymerase sigma-70 factor (ECF subfamily)
VRSAPLPSAEAKKVNNAKPAAVCGGEKAAMVASFPRQMAMTAAKAQPIAVTDDVEQLVREHARFVFRVAYSVLRNHHDAEDAAQETFLRVLRQRGRLAEVEDPRAWIGTIAWRIAMERRRPTAEVDLDVAADYMAEMRARGASAEEMVEQEQMSGVVWGLVETLPADLRDAITLSTVQEMSSAEAGEALGVPEGTVRNRVHRAKEMLRQKLTAALERRK